MPVLEHSRLARVFAALERRYGTQTAAAGALKISPVYFWRRRHMKGGASITPALFNRIAGLVEADRRLTRDLFRAVASKDTRTQRHAYRMWLRKNWRRVQPGWPESSTHHSEWFALVRLFPKYADSYISSFVKHLEARHSAAHWNHRVWLAVAQVLSPLVATIDTGGIERAWWELDETNELGSYLKASLRSQEILLHREANLLTRSQEITDRRTGK